MDRLINMLYVIHRENMTILQIMSKLLFTKTGEEKIKSVIDDYEKLIKNIDNEVDDGK